MYLRASSENVFFHLVILFWYQVLSIFSLMPRVLERATRFILVKYLILFKFPLLQFLRLKLGKDVLIFLVLVPLSSSLLILGRGERSVGLPASDPESDEEHSATEPFSSFVLRGPEGIKPLDGAVDLFTVWSSHACCRARGGIPNANWRCPGWFWSRMSSLVVFAGWTGGRNSPSTRTAPQIFEGGSAGRPKMLFMENFLFSEQRLAIIRGNRCSSNSTLLFQQRHIKMIIHKAVCYFNLILL